MPSEPFGTVKRNTQLNFAKSLQLVTLGTDRHMERADGMNGTGTRNVRWWSGWGDRGKIGVGRPSHGECVVGSAADPAFFLELEGHEKKAQSVRTFSSIKFKQGSWSARSVQQGTGQQEIRNVGTARAKAVTIVS